MLATQKIATQLRRDILEGRLKPGDELRQETLADRFKVSRMPIRDALNALAADRLISLLPNRGAQVVALSSREIAEVIDLRILLEGDVLKHALAAMTKEDFAEIQRESLRCEIEAGTPEFPLADWRFHRALYRPSGRNRQIRMIGELRALCQMHRAAYDSLRQSSQRWSEDHRNIIGFIEAGDFNKAIAELRVHIQGSGDQLVGWMAEHADQ